MYNSHDLAIKIKTIAKERGIPIKDMLVTLKLGSNTMSSLYHGKSIAFDSLAQIADYLNCSVDYLLGRTDNPNVTADTYINGDNNNNGTQAINGSVSVTASSDSGRKDTLTEQFIQKFEQLDFDEKIDVMQYVKDIKKSAAPQDG